MVVDEEDEHYSTGYSEFCDDDTILLAAPDTISTNDYSSPAGSSPATTLGKRKSPEDPGPSNTVYASYKRQTSTSVSDVAESANQPYIIVSLDQSSAIVPKKKFHARQ